MIAPSALRALAQQRFPTGQMTVEKATILALLNAVEALKAQRDAVAQAAVKQIGGSVTMSARNWHAICEDRNFAALAPFTETQT